MAFCPHRRSYQRYKFRAALHLVHVITIGRFSSLRVSMSQSTGEKWGAMVFTWPLMITGVRRLDWNCWRLSWKRRPHSLCPLPDNTKVVMNCINKMRDTSHGRLASDVGLNHDCSVSLNFPVTLTMEEVPTKRFSFTCTRLVHTRWAYPCHERDVDDDVDGVVRTHSSIT